MFNLTNEQIQKYIKFAPIILIVLSIISYYIFVNFVRTSPPSETLKSNENYNVVVDSESDSYEITFNEDFYSKSKEEQYEIYNRIVEENKDKDVYIEFIPSSNLKDNTIYKDRIEEFEKEMSESNNSIPGNGYPGEFFEEFDNGGISE